MASLQKLFGALQVVERFAKAREQHMSFSACASCAKASAVLHGGKRGTELLVEIHVLPSGEVTYLWPLAPTPAVQEALNLELAKYVLQ